MVDVIKESATSKMYFKLPHIPVTECNSYNPIPKPTVDILDNNVILKCLFVAIKLSIIHI